MSGHQEFSHGERVSYYHQQSTRASYQDSSKLQYSQPPYQQPSYEQPQYAQPPEEPPPNYQTDSEKQDFNQVFRIERPQYHDVWAGVLLILVFLGFVVVSGLTIHSYATTRGFNGDGLADGRNDVGLTTGTIILFAFVLLAAFVLSAAYLGLARLAPRALIWASGILNIIVGLATAAYMLSRHYWSGGIVFLLFAVWTLVCFISWIPRIPFSALMLTTSVDVAARVGHVFAASLTAGLIALALAAWYQVTLVAVYVAYEPGRNPACRDGDGACSRAKVVGLLVFVTFAAFWVSEWLKNTLHATVAGVYGSWYFCQGSAPANATRTAFRRAVTYSFGSISLGSLFVAVINTLRYICSANRRQAWGSGNILEYVLFCVLSVLLWLLDWIVQFVNRMAFCHIALYGKAYFAAAKDTWKMLRDRGIDALANHCLVGPVFNMGGIFVGFACALVGYCCVVFTDQAYNSEGQYTPVIVAFSFLIGLQICNIVTTPIASGIDTIFVAAAWDPEVLMRDHPDLYARMVSVYPHVQQAIHA